jgi:hypothetical protein
VDLDVGQVKAFEAQSPAAVGRLGLPGDKIVPTVMAVGLGGLVVEGLGHGRRG